MGDLEPLRVHRRAEAPRLLPAAIPARLRHIFSPPNWGRRPEPQVRYGQPFLPGLAALGDEQPPDSRAYLEQAAAVGGRRFTCLGRTVAFPGHIDWNPRGLPEAWLVALNALDDVLPLGVAAALARTSETRHRWYGLTTGLVGEWIAGTRPGRGVAWKVPALARRIPNLIYVHALFARELRADPRARRALLESLYRQTAALAAAMPAHGADPSLVAAGRALFMAGRFFDGLEARAWLESGVAILWGQLREQVREDGGHRERNPTTHALVLADYIEVLALLTAAHEDVPVWARKRVKGMAEFLARLVHPDGEIPLFHGAGLGLARSARDLLAATAAVLGEPGFAPEGDPGLWPLLVVGGVGPRVHLVETNGHRAPAPRALRRTGFYVLPGDPGDVMILDGASPPPGGAGSAFGYELSVGGRRLVVGSGTGGLEESRWAAYFRSTRAHNVVSVAGAEQMHGGRPPEVSDVHWVVRDGLIYFAATHDGFARLTPHVAPDQRLRHRRHVFALRGRFWLVCDEILGEGTWEVESFVHFHPATTLRAACQGRPALVADRGGDASLQVVPAGVREVRVVHGTETPVPQGWYAARPGERRATSALSLVTTRSAPFVFGYALLPRTDGPAVLHLGRDAFHLRIRLGIADAQEYVLTVAQGDVEINATRDCVSGRGGGRA